MVDYGEFDAQGIGKFTGPSAMHYSTELSQFQCIGWILECLDKTNGFCIRFDIRVDEKDYEREGLLTVGRLSEAAASALLETYDWEERFEIVWTAIDAEQKDIALGLNYEEEQNFWPCFEKVAKASKAEDILTLYKDALSEP
jgi:hypothetical protein